MIPLRDDLPGRGAPAPALLACVALLAAGTAAPGGGIALGLAVAFAAWLFVPSLVRDAGWLATFAMIAAGAAAAGALALAAGAGWQPWAVVGAAATPVAGHLVRFRGSRMITLVPLPLRAGLAEVPSGVVAIVWAVPVCLIASGA